MSLAVTLVAARPEDLPAAIEAVELALQRIDAPASTPDLLGPNAADLIVQSEHRALVRERAEQALEGRAVDVCVQPVEGRRKRLLVADMDSTIIGCECIDELADFAGVKAEVAEITERAMRGELDFVQALRARVAVLRGLPTSVLDEVAARLTLERGIVAFAEFARQLEVPLFVVSGGFTPLAKAVTRPLQLAGMRANDLEVSGGALTGQVQGDVVDAAAKRSFVLEQCAKFGFAPEEVAAVGDGANDLLMLGAVGTAVGFNPKPILREAVHACCDDHAFLAPLLFGRGLATTRARRPA